MKTTLRRILFTAAAGLLAAAVVIAVLLIPRPTPAGPSAPLSSHALGQPAYPQFPQQPVFDETNVDWEKYNQQMNAYYDALFALRGDGPVSGQLGIALNRFAQQTAPGVLRDTGGKNAVYSPLSLWSALAMLARCAEGESRQQVLDALGVDSAEQADELVSELWRKLYTDDGLSSLIFANSIWLNSSMEGSYVQETVDALAQKHYAGSFAVPMGTPDADRAVSDWTAEQTRGLIGGDQPVTQTKEETLALLLSSLYYKAAWWDKFHPSANTTDTFTAADGSKTDATFMHRSENSGFIRTEDYQAAWLPTQLGAVTFVLPSEGIAPEELAARPGFWAGLDRRADNGNELLYGKIQWSVPKFDADSRLNLMDTLADLGITQVIDPNKADLSGISSLPAFVSNVEQLGRVKVDEEGVEAAAVTIITMDATGAPMEPEQVCVMDLDRPFLFAIYHEGIPLFTGIVNEV